MDIVTQPVARTRGRSKRNSEPRPAGNTPAGTNDPHPVDGTAQDPAPGTLSELQGELSRIQHEHARTAELLERAEQDLDTANQRLLDSDAARRHLLDNVASGGEEARRRFATALHDEVLQQLTAAELQLERIRMDARRTRYAAPLDQLKATPKQVEESLRGLLYNVSPAAPDEHVQLGDALRERLQALKSHTGIEPDLDLRLPKRIPDALKSIVFKIVSEALTNVEKHASATRVTVKAEVADGGIRAVVADDGSGFVVAESLYLPGHLGLLAMRERAQLAGGWCRIASDPGTGTRISFWIPNSL